MEDSSKLSRLLEILAKIELPESLKTEAIEAEQGVTHAIMSQIEQTEDVIGETTVDINIEIRKAHLAEHKHKWDENLKVTQAKFNKWSRKEYDEKLHNVEHNYNHLLQVIHTDDYDNHLELIQKVDAHEDTIETLLAFQQRKQEQEEYLQNNPPEAFINRVAKERVEIKKRRRDRSLKLKEKLKSAKEIQEEKHKELIEQQKQQRLQELEKQKEKRLQEKAEYDKVLTEANSSLVSPLPLYRKIETNYKKRVLMPELEKKKEMLKSIRNLHKPLDFAGLQEHARAYSQRRAESIEKKRRERETQIKEQVKNYQFTKHKSMFLLNVLENEKEQKELEAIKSAEQADLYEKKKNYGKLVQQMHKPIVSHRKRLEVKINKSKLKHVPRSGMVLNSRAKTNKISVTSTKNSDRHNSPAHSVGRSEYRSYFTENTRMKPLKRWRENEMVPKPKKKKEVVVTDYLLERRIKHEEQSMYGEDPIKKKPLEWKTLVEGMTGQDKTDFLLNKARMLEEKAQILDEQNKLIEYDSKLNEESDELLIEALKAKLQALENA